MTAVGVSALSRATQIKELHVPEGVTYIGAYAFRGCTNMTKAYLPASLETLGYGALGVYGSEHYACLELNEIFYAGTVDAWNKLYEEYNAPWKTLAWIVVHCSDGDIKP